MKRLIQKIFKSFNLKDKEYNYNLLVYVGADYYYKKKDISFPLSCAILTKNNKVINCFPLIPKLEEIKDSTFIYQSNQNNFIQILDNGNKEVLFISPVKMFSAFQNISDISSDILFNIPEINLSKIKIHRKSVTEDCNVCGSFYKQNLTFSYDSYDIYSCKYTFNNEECSIPNLTGSELFGDIIENKNVINKLLFEFLKNIEIAVPNINFKVLVSIEQNINSMDNELKTIINKIINSSLTVNKKELINLANKALSDYLKYNDFEYSSILSKRVDKGECCIGGGRDGALSFARRIFLDCLNNSGIDFFRCYGFDEYKYCSKNDSVEIVNLTQSKDFLIPNVLNLNSVQGINKIRDTCFKSFWD